MPQIIPIVINDGASTPVAKTFSPKMVKDGILSVFEEAVGVPQLRRKLNLTVRPPVGNGYYRLKLEISTPLGATDGVTGVTTVRGTNRSVHEFLIHESSSTLEIDHLLAFADNSLANVFVKECIRTLAPGY